MAYKLLLADDSVTIQRVIELTFADEDVQVVAVGDGQQAIDRIKADPPDIVLADVGMPARDGYEVAAFVKETPELSHIPVLLLTGAFEPVDEARAKAVQCNGMLAKPFEPQLLISRVKELLAPAARAAAAAPASSPAGTDDETGPVPVAAAVLPGEAFDLDHASLADAASGGASPDLSLDDYFDRLDAAFASLSGTSAKDQPSRDSDVSWAPPSSGAWTEGAPVSADHAARAAEVPAPANAAADEPRAGVAPAVVPVADAFAALLEAEQTGAPLPAFTPEPVNVATAPASIPAAAPLTDALVEELTRRVAERLAEKSVRDLVAQVVSETAERLVREEIERLKAGASH